MNKRYRRPLIAGNWKMHKLPSEVEAYMTELAALLPENTDCDVAVFASFPLLPAAAKSAGERICIGAQDVSRHDSGAYTGEVSALMLRDLGVTRCIVGHSECRIYREETDIQINGKVHALLKSGIKPLICVGESLGQRERGLTMDFVNYQLRAAVSGLDPQQMQSCAIGYEPIWAIGTGHTATAEQAQEVCATLRATLKDVFGADTAKRVPILYGGSMNAKNCEELLAMPDIDGGLVGGASLNPVEFARIVAAATEG